MSAKQQVTSSVGSGSSSRGLGWLDGISIPGSVTFLVLAVGAAAVPCSEGEGKLFAPFSVELEPGASLSPCGVVLSQILSCRDNKRFPFEGNSSL